MRRLLLATFLLTACGDKTDPHARDVCEKAADRWGACVLEVLGPEAAKMADGKRDIGACARDPHTVAMYEKCLAAATCDEMIDCMMGEAAK